MKILLTPRSKSAVTHWDKYYIYCTTDNEPARIIEGADNELSAKRAVSIFDEHEQRNGRDRKHGYIHKDLVSVING